MNDRDIITWKIARILQTQNGSSRKHWNELGKTARSQWFNKADRLLLRLERSFGSEPELEIRIKK